MKPRTTVRSSTTGTALTLVARMADMSQNLASLAPVPALSLAVATAVAIINLVQEVKANKEDCVRLAYRASRMLLDLGRRMEGKWDNAPLALLESVRDFQHTLAHVRDFMTSASEDKWIKRFVAKNDFQAAVQDFSAQLDAASESFQLASLIEIHYTVGRMLPYATSTEVKFPVPNLPLVEREANSDANTEVAPDLPNASPADPGRHARTPLPESKALVPSSTMIEDTSEVDTFIAQLDGEKDAHGFRIYHQSEVRMGRLNRRGVGWFSNTGAGQVHGQKVTIKHYDSGKQSTRQWVRDIKLLRQLFHENIPQMVGYSDGKTSIPFVLLANGPTKDVGLYVQSVLKNENLAGSVRAILNMYRDIVSAAMHIRQQLSLSDDKVQDYIEDATYTVDDQNNVLMGIIPPREGTVTFRSYNLCESLSDRALKYLKELEAAEESAVAGSIARSSVVGKTRQLRSLLESLLPRKNDDPDLHSELHDLLDDEPDDTTLSRLRQISLANGRHTFAWRERCPPDTLSIGDYGYMPNAGKDFANFKILGNIYEPSGAGSCTLNRTKEIEGTYSQWVGGHTKQKPASPYLLEDSLEGWSVALMLGSNVTVFIQRKQCFESLNETWRHFLECAPTIAERHGVHPHNLILVTRMFNVNDFVVDDWSPPRITHHRPPNMSSMSHSRSNHMRDPFHGPPEMPEIVFLFTSGKTGFVPYITDSPMGQPRPLETRSTSWCFSLRVGWPVDSADYIQFEKEDFE